MVILAIDKINIRYLLYAQGWYGLIEGKWLITIGVLVEMLIWVNCVVNIV
jgi:hypothetical protein